jgi:hypothetical protein
MNRRILSLLFLGLFVFFAVAGMSRTAFAADAKKTDTKSNTTSSTTTSTGAASLQAYSADTPIANGTMVELKDSKAGKVAVSSKPDQAHMYGVTVDPSTLAVTISNAAIQNQVYVATSGTYPTLVSNQGGDIKAGDYVTMSAIDGVAKKADSDAKTVFGRAASAYTASNGFSKATLKDSTGKETQQVTIGIIPVSIDVRSNPISKSTKVNAPKFLERIGEAIAEKQVSPVRIYISLFVMAVSIVSAIVILYSGVRNSLISIGRNPLSKKSILRGLFEIILTSLLILIIGLFAVYLLLKL